MNDAADVKIVIDEDFRNLIRPINRQSYCSLERSLLSEGCLSPIITWNGILVDGHNRFELCTRHGIPFRVEEKDFSCREAVLAWICTVQLRRMDLTEETRKYLIGKRYMAEKTLRKMNKLPPSLTDSIPACLPPERRDDRNTFRSITSRKLGAEYHVSPGTVEKYSKYAEALDEIRKKEAKLVPKILSGKYKVSHDAVLELANLNRAEISAINRRLEMTRQPYAQYQTTRNEIKNISTDPNASLFRECSTVRGPSVKDMPEYDPDAEVTGLTLTIPSWRSSIERVRLQSDFPMVSENARSSLISALFELQKTISDMFRALRED